CATSPSASLAPWWRPSRAACCALAAGQWWRLAPRRTSDSVAPQDATVSVRRRLRLTLEFDGTDFYGWQRQAHGERTVQATLEAAFAALPGDHSAVLAAGRTDAGVHALAMVAHVDT